MLTKKKILLALVASLGLTAGLVGMRSVALIKDSKLSAAAPIAKQKRADLDKLHASLTKGMETSQDFDKKRAEIMAQWKAFSSAP
jgi:hypothetical protein